mgnify:CR=1 FL=1
MNTFIKTFFICLFIALAFITYKFISNDSYNSNLNVSKENPIFGLRDYDPVVKKEPESPIAQETQEKKENKVYVHTCYFYLPNGELTPIKRELTSPTTLKASINLLLKGPTIAESKQGIYSEIPPNVDLISLKINQKSVIVNLTSNFGNGGGSESVENRVKQLAKTVRVLVPNKPIYLHINNKEVEYLGGDGVFVKQPLEY